MVRPNLFLRSQQGLTLLELLVTVIISSIILGVSLGLIVTQRRQYINQQATTDVNQTIQSAMDLIGIDVRQAGGKVGLGLGLPIIRIINGGGAAPDTLVLQSKLLTQDLTVCDQVNGNPASIRVVDKSAVGCTFTDGLPSNGLPDNVEEWRAYRCQISATKPACTSPPGDCKQTTPASLNDECTWAYIFNPDTGDGEFFLYSGEAQEGSAANQRYRINKSGATSITKTYPVGSKLYILEERRYALGAPDAKGDRILELSLVDRDTNTVFNNAPLQIVNRLRDFQVKGIDTAGAEMDAFNVSDPPTSPYEDWTALRAIKVSFSVEKTGADAPIIQTLTSQFFPRNSLSRPAP
jgi:prepilin-type N-terminal cleavage/methylation domain-containing protein